MSGARDVVLIQAFSEVLREFRAEIGITQEQLAFGANVDRTFIGLLENAKRQPSLSVIYGLSSALGTTPEDLLRRVSERLRTDRRPGGTP